MDERKTLKLNIQRTTICFLVVLSLLVGVSAAETTAPTIADAVKLSDYSYEIVNNNDGTETVTSYLPEDPVYQWEIVRPSYASGWHTTTGGGFEVSFEGATDNGLLLTGYVWPNGKIIDISELVEDGVFNVNYDCTFNLNLPPYPMSSGDVYVSLVPRFRLLRSTGGQIAFVNGENVWNSMIHGDGSEEALVIHAKGMQEIDLNVPNELPQYPLKYIELKWQFNIRVEFMNDAGLYFWMDKDSLNFSYDRQHVLTDSELAAKLNDEVGKISDDLDAAGDAFNSVPKPDIDEVMKPIDEVLPQQGMAQLSGAIGMITGTSLVATQFTILGVVLVVSYVLFGKKEAG